MKKFFNKLSRGNSKQTISSINSIKELYLIIERETKRADRYSLRISLAVFEVKSSDENNIIVRRLVRIMHKRIRSADAIGWYAKKQIGVLLPHTPEHGAWKVTEAIYNLLSSTDSLPPYTVYTYPSDNWPIKAKKTFQKIIIGFGSLFTFSSRHSIPDSNEIRAALDLEMDRAIRHNYIFSLLILDLTQFHQIQDVLKKITRAINTNLRDTDLFGWYKENSLAIILPYANNEQARTTSLRILTQTNLSKDDIFKIFTYPTHWFDNKNTNHTQSDRLSTHEPSPTGQERRKDAVLNKNHITSLPSNKEDYRQGTQTSEIDSFIAKPLPIWKRSMDIIGSLIGLFFLSPIMLFTAIGIKLSSPGPVLFVQKRVGFQKKKFPLIKFRSMRIDSGAENHRKFMETIIKDGKIKDTKIQDDPRIFPFGKFMRKTSIDELPQLINVLKGEMSLVGPRPCLDYEADIYLRWHTKRFFTTPGLTGLWQVSGKNRLSFMKMIRLDIYYQKHFSPWLDIKIILLTIPAIISILLEKKNMS
ncbi:sugar transferase [Desulfobacula sp.]